MRPDKFQKMYSQAKERAKFVDAAFHDTGTSWRRGGRTTDRLEEATHSAAINDLQACVSAILAEPLTMAQLKQLESIHWHPGDRQGGQPHHIEVGTAADFNPLLAAALNMPDTKTAAIFMGATNIVVKDVYGNLVLPAIEKI